MVTRRAESGYEVPKADALVVGLRLGDVVDDSRKRERASRYVKGVDYYDRIAKSLPAAVQRVSVVGSAVHSEGLRTSTASERYRDSVARAFERAGYGVDVRPPGLPDEDFVYIAGARYVAVWQGTW